MTELDSIKYLKYTNENNEYVNTRVTFKDGTIYWFHGFKELKDIDLTDSIGRYSGSRELYVNLETQYQKMIINK